MSSNAVAAAARLLLLLLLLQRTVRCVFAVVRFHFVRCNKPVSSFVPPTQTTRDAPCSGAACLTRLECRWPAAAARERGGFSAYAQHSTTRKCTNSTRTSVSPYGRSLCVGGGGWSPCHQVWVVAMHLARIIIIVKRCETHQDETASIDVLEDNNLCHNKDAHKRAVQRAQA